MEGINEIRKLKSLARGRTSVNKQTNKQWYYCCLVVQFVFLSIDIVHSIQKEYLRSLITGEWLAEIRKWVRNAGTCPRSKKSEDYAEGGLSLSKKIGIRYESSLGRECGNRSLENPGIAKKGGGSHTCQDFLVDL